MHCVQVKLSKYFQHSKQLYMLRVDDLTSSDSLHLNMVRVASWSARLPWFGSSDSAGISICVCV
jgi:hypothetical protein